MKKVIVIIVSLMLIVSPVYALNSEGVIYDNGTSGSNATNVNDALNDLYSKLNNKQTEINNIKKIGNATSDKILSGYTAYVKGNTITGSIPSKGTTTYTPGVTNQTIASGQYISGAQTIKGDANLIAGNIAKGKSIFGVNGSYTSDANAVAGNILSGKTAYVNGSKITGSMPSRSNSGNVAQDKAWLYSNRVYFGLETGYYPSSTYGGMTGVSERYITYESLAKTIGLTANKLISGNTILGVSGSIPSKGATTYTPGVSNQTIASGQYLSGAQTIKGDANLVAGNIAKGKSIFGVSGTYTSDANAVAGNILSGKTAYVNGSKITGTISSKSAATYTPGVSNQTISSGYYLSGTQTIKGDSNLLASNIAKGKTIFGVSGTYTGDSSSFGVTDSVVTFGDSNTNLSLIFGKRNNSSVNANYIKASELRTSPYVTDLIEVDYNVTNTQSYTIKFKKNCKLSGRTEGGTIYDNTSFTSGSTLKWGYTVRVMFFIIAA